jgi:microcystin-dependent protein
MPRKLKSTALRSDAVTVANIPNGEITAAKLHDTAIQDKLGYVPASAETVASQISALVDSAPTTLDTLNELATAILSSETTLQAYVNNRLPIGVIVMWSGSIASIPTGWVLCDGTNGTPNLRDRFIVGAGNTYSVATTGGSANATIPSHSHTFSGSGNTSTAGNHSHQVKTKYEDDSTIRPVSNARGGMAAAHYAGSAYYRYDDLTGAYMLASNGDHSHSVSISGSTSSTGDSATNANLPPYYALAYIMKL